MASLILGLGSLIGKADENPIRRWILLTGGRFKLMVLLIITVFLMLFGLSLTSPAIAETLLEETNEATVLFTTLLSGSILLVSIVVSINAVTLSQEISDLENQKQRVEASLEYHRHIEEYIEADIAPAQPAYFLTAVLYGMSSQIERLSEVADDSSEPQFQEDVDTLTSQMVQEIHRTRYVLRKADLGTFKVLLAGLNYNYSGQLYSIRGLKRKHGEAISEAEEAEIDRLVEILNHVGIGREYFKSLYFKRELAHLSRRLLYITLPLIVFISYVILALDASVYPKVTIMGLSPLLLSITFGYSLALAPYILLTAYILRASTISLRTLAAGPFVLQEGNKLKTLDWDDPETDREWSLEDYFEDR